MCGILGSYSSEKKIIGRFKNAMKSLSHRGPDSQGLSNFEIADNSENFNLLTLGHLRLSIIDLSSQGNQPMSSGDKRFTIVFNGEIYNYIELRKELIEIGYNFKTNSDTEVLIALWAEWGSKGLKKIIGMFAFAIYDEQNYTITIARDAFGIKPLYYTNKNNNFFFSSEINALLELIPENITLNIQRSYDYLVHGDYDSEENSFINDIKHLMPAHCITYDLKTHKSEIERWWEINIKDNKNINYKTAVNNLKNIFIDSVKFNLRSDVPFGINLSGGIDSSAIASVVKLLQPSKEINTFSYISSDPTNSEEKWIDLLVNKLNVKSNRVKISSNDLAKDLENLITRQGEPFGGTSIYAQFKLFEFIKKNKVKVVLDGQGADEILAGYYGYPGQRALSLLETEGIIAAHSFIKKWSIIYKKNYFLGWMYFFRLILSDRWYQIFHKLLNKIFYFSLSKNFNPKWFKLKKNKNKISLREKRYILKKENRGKRVKEAMKNAIYDRGLQALLRHGDRNSMTFSIENRVPFLSIPFVEFLFSLPESFFFSNEGLSKNIFRDAMRGIVPDEILNRKDKIGFETPQQKWITKNYFILRNYIKNGKEINFVNKKNLLKEFDEAINDQKKFNSKIWRWANFYKWLDTLPVSKISHL